MTLDEARALGVGGRVIVWPSMGYAGPLGEGIITAIGDGPNGWVRCDFPNAEGEPFLAAWYDPEDLAAVR
jgi:hypothetical protein